MSVIEEIATIISSSSVASSASFDSGMLLLDVSKAISSSVESSSSSTDSGKVMVSVMKSLNSEISSSSSVEKETLFKEVTTVINEKYSSASSSEEVTPASLMVVVITAVNEKLGSSVSTTIETAELYIKTLKVISSEFSSVSSLSSNSKTEATTIISTSSAISEALKQTEESSSTDIGMVMETVATKVQEAYAESTLDTASLAVNLMEEVTKQISSETRKQVLRRQVYFRKFQNQFMIPQKNQRVLY